MAAVVSNRLITFDMRSYEFSCHLAAFNAMMRLHNPGWESLWPESSTDADLLLEREIEPE